MGYDEKNTDGWHAVSLTSGTFQNFVQVNVPSGGGFGGLLMYSVVSTAGDAVQVRAGTTAFAVLNKLGTESGGFDAISVDEVRESEGGSTLSVSFGVSTSPTNGVILTCNPTSSLTTPTITLYFKLDIAGDNTRITPFN